MTPKPGLYYHMPFAEYLAADAVSMSALGVLLDSFPARLLHQQRETAAMSVGQIAHALVLEGRDIADSEKFIVVPDGFSMKHVNKHADLIAEIERRPTVKTVREPDVEMIRAMAAALRDDPQIKTALSNGRPEVSAFWIEPEYGLLCRARFDWLPNHGNILPDYKTAASIDREPLERAIKNFRTAHRSCWYEDAARHAADRDDPLYMPLWQEKAPPYFAVMKQVNPAHVALARLELGRALAIYADCKSRGVWPGPKHFEPIDLPGYEVRRLEIEYQNELAVSAQAPADPWGDLA